MFSKEKAYHHLASLAYPRGVGSPGEERARKYINRLLELYGITVKNQDFCFSKIIDYLTRILPFLAGLCLWGITVLFPFQSWIPVCLLGSIIIILSILSFLPIQIGRLHKINAKIKSSNIIGFIPSLSEPKRHIVFIAHYDSKSQTLPIAIRTFCISLLILSLLLIMFSHLFSYFFPIYPFFHVNRLSGFLSLLSGLLLFTNFTRNLSPGVADNASGVSIVLELARIFSKNPLGNTQITLLFTCAEEYGMAGAFFYVENNPVSKLNTSFINIDGVGDSSPIGIVRARKSLFSSTGKRLFNEIVQTADLLFLPFVPLKTLIGIGFDHIPIASRGFNVVTLCSYSIQMVLRIHSKRDLIDYVCVNSLDNIGRLCEKYAREWDSNKLQDL
ncbi:MAG: M28 family peptidase [Chitinispirillia bacterium]|jgi:hypothetical protein